MEKHVLHGVISADFRRPGKDLIARLSVHDAAKVADAMAGLSKLE